MINIRARAVWTALIAGSVLLLIPVAVFVLFRTYMSRLITRDNTDIVLQEFQTAIDHGTIVHDPADAALVAERAYRERSNAVPLDGWGHHLEIAAELHGDSCTLNVQSAGPDGLMGTGDDLTESRSYNLSSTGSKAVAQLGK